ncbi:hypothetical protein GIW81_15390 [Hyphomicrobium sp. xq]|uniref:Uncharacterized protein n=1 Tax=Hyphomicrobium album TaxID=2665159 RepID=A0A6I3KMP4_9HYPH|nr:hypothetical protein [Hyphomicrobium album]MTD95723.1 hypothetical protein [Hyphomicrobium album]
MNSPERPKKFLIYLDQNFISEMAKLGINDRVRPDFRRLFDLLHTGFRAEKLVVLRSTIHEVETSLAGHLRDAIRGRQSMLGHVHLETPYAVKRRQIGRALCRYTAGTGNILCHDDVLEDDPDKRVGQFDIDVDMDWRFAQAKEQRAELAARLETLRKRVAESRISYEEQRRIELATEREAMLTRASIAEFTTVYEVTVETWRQFVASAAFASIPIVDLEVSLIARVLTGNPNRTIKPGDSADLDAVAAYLPYSDTYATDAFAATLVRSLAYHSKYKCPVFDAKSAGVNKLIEHLCSTLESMKPVNLPALTIFVAADGSVKEQSWELYRQLGSQARATGEWIEIYGFDDGSMPRYQMRQMPHIPAPFYGLQEVTTLSCSADASIDRLLEECRRQCRSTHFVFIDSAKPLSPHFVVGALMACEVGMTQIEGYGLHRAALTA